jgi:Sulfotransferase family
MADTRSDAGQAGANVAFLVGAGRSGTTLLYKLLCLHPDVAYISNYDIRFPWLPAKLISLLSARSGDAKVRAWFKSGGNAYIVSRPWLKKFVPTPVEGEDVFARSGVPLFPSPGYEPDPHSGRELQTRFERMRTSRKAQIIVSKRTANNRRLPQLDTIFPNARYVHLIRDGRAVAHSLSRVEWWEDHVLWWGDGRTAAQMERDGEERLSICARNWVRELEIIRRGLADIAPQRILEVRYERLLADPRGELGNILSFLELAHVDEFQAAVSALRLSNRPESWATRWTADQLAHVLREEQPLLSELGYA